MPDPKTEPILYLASALERCKKCYGRGGYLFFDNRSRAGYGRTTGSADRGEAMKPYNPGLPCPKCGFADVSTSYCTDGPSSDYERHSNPHADVRNHEEHLDRVCQRCHYRWIEAIKEHTDVNNS